MKVSTSILYLAILFSLSSCQETLYNTVVVPEGEVKKIERSYSNFNQVDVHGAFEVLLTKDQSEVVVIEANENIHQYIIIEKKNNRLVIETEKNVQFAKNTKIRIFISTREIVYLGASGACQLIATNLLEENTLNINLSGASTLLANLDCKSVIANITGASILTLSGKSEYYNLFSSGASISNGFELSIDNFKCDISGASIVNHTIIKTLEVKASGASIVNYRGSGIVISSELSGISIINKK